MLSLVQVQTVQIWRGAWRLCSGSSSTYPLVMKHFKFLDSFYIHTRHSLRGIRKNTFCEVCVGFPTIVFYQLLNHQTDTLQILHRRLFTYFAMQFQFLATLVQNKANLHAAIHENFQAFCQPFHTFCLNTIWETSAHLNFIISIYK
jgi:hypothetical protein